MFFQIFKLTIFRSLAPSNIHLYFSGNPVWPGTDLTVNTCDNLDWLRAFGTHLWYLTSPAASISDALNLYEEAFQKETTQFGAYAKPPCPSYLVATPAEAENDNTFDIRFHLLKLYANKAHKIESIVVPKTYTHQPLDNKLGWLVSQIFFGIFPLFIFFLCNRLELFFHHIVVA